jgi:hypothetical protein
MKYHLAVKDNIDVKGVVSVSGCYEMRADPLANWWHVNIAQNITVIQGSASRWTKWRTRHENDCFVPRSGSRCLFSQVNCAKLKSEIDFVEVRDTNLRV